LQGERHKAEPLCRKKPENEGYEKGRNRIQRVCATGGNLTGAPRKREKHWKRAVPENANPKTMLFWKRKTTGGVI